MSQSKNTITNFLWRFAERCGTQGVSFIVSLVLARPSWGLAWAQPVFNNAVDTVILWLTVKSMICRPIQISTYVMAPLPLGAVIFVAGSALLKLEAFTYLWGMVGPAVKKLWKRGRVQ